MAEDMQVATGLPVLDRYDSRLVQELALGMEDDDTILERYGFDTEGVARLRADPFLQAEVAALTQELRRAGTMAKVKARLAAEDLITTVYNRVKLTKTLQDALDALKVLAKIGDLEPRSDGAKVTGTIVRVDLNIGQLGFPPAAHAVIDVPVVSDASQNLELFAIEGSTPAALLGLELDVLQWEEPAWP